MYHLGKRNGTSQGLERRRDLASDKTERINSRCNHTVEVRRDLSGNELVQQTSSFRSTDGKLKLTVLDGAKVDGVESASCRVAAEQDRVLKVHGQDLGGDVEVGVGSNAVGPVVGDAFAAGEAPSSVGVLFSTKEGGDGLEVGCVAVVSIGHEGVEERSGSVEKQSQRTKEEVGVLLEGLVVALQAVFGKILAVEVALAGVLHHAEESAVEGVVVSVGKEVVVSGERRVGFKLVVAIETRFRACEDRAEGGSGCGITSDGKLLGHKIAVGKGETKSGEKCGQIVSNIVKVLLGIHKLVECGDTIVRKEVVIGLHELVGS
jgi:hypothetical protein